MSGLRVRATGPLALVEDLGRRGLAGVGVGRSGAADRGALRLANRLLGNPEGAAAVEVLLGGLEVEALADLDVVVTGAPAPVLLDGRPVGSHARTRVAAGSRLALGVPGTGLRSYLAVRGGLGVPPVLGSASHDVLAGLGRAPLAAGDLLAVGEPAGPLPATHAAPPPGDDGRDVVLRAVLGPHEDRLVDVAPLATGWWEVSERSNRVGARLQGEGLVATDDEQLPSEGTWRGAVQVPPGGEPVLFLADHPVTGGYPVVAVVVDADVDRAAQLRPGQRVRLRWVTA